VSTTQRGSCYQVLCVVCVLMVAVGCAPTRSEYYSSMERQRVESFRRWESRSRKDQRPRVDGALSLDEAVRLALLYNPQLLAALQQKEVARGRVVESYSEALPKVNVTAGYVRMDEVPSIALGSLDNYSFRVTVTQPLFSGSMMIAPRAARLYAFLSDESIRQAVEAVVYRVARGYFDAVVAQQLVGMYEDALRSAEAHLKAVEARREEGVATEYDVLRARVDVSNIQADLIEQERLQDIARTGLLRALGVDQESIVDLATPLTYDQQEPPSFAEAVRAAFYNRPDIYRAAITVDLQELAVRDAKTRYWPRLEAYFWDMLARPDPHGSGSGWGAQWQAGLNLMWTAFDGFSREGRIIQQKALLRQLEIQLDDAEEQTLLELKDALLELQSARELVESQKLNLERANRALELVVEGYNVKVNTEIEVLDAQAALARARALHYRALHRHACAKLALRRATGLLASPPGSQSVPKNVPNLTDISLPPERQAQAESTAGPAESGGSQAR